MRAGFLSGAVITMFLLGLAPPACAATAPTMWPISGPPTGDTVVVISGGSGFTDQTTVTVGIRTVAARASADGTRLTFSTPAADPNLANPAGVTTNNPSTPGLPAFTYQSTVVPGTEGLTGTVRRADGTPLPGAEVWIIRVYDEGILARTTADAAGRYQLAVPAGAYYGAFAMEHSTWSPEVGFWGLTIAAGGSTELDWVIPSLSSTTQCAVAVCRLRVSVAGFGALNPVELHLGIPDFDQLIGTLTADAAGAGTGVFTFARPTGKGYYLTAVTGGHDTYLAKVSSGVDMRVPPKPCTASVCRWSAALRSPALSASLALPSSGWATAEFAIAHLGSGVTVAARIVSGPACRTGGETILVLPGYTTTIGGTWTQRWIFDSEPLRRLRAAVHAGSPLWFSVNVAGHASCVLLQPSA